MTRYSDAVARYQLAERLADLIDLYQVYRLDWLQDWEKDLMREDNLIAQIQAASLGDGNFGEGSASAAAAGQN